MSELNESAVVQPVVTGEIPNISVDDAITHLHNMAHDSLSLLVLLGILRTVKQQQTELTSLLADVEAAKKERERLHDDVEKWRKIRGELNNSVSELQSRHTELSSLISDQINTITTTKE